MLRNERRRITEAIYREKHRERLRAYKTKYAAEHQDQIKAWRKKNKEKLNAQIRNYILKNPEKYAARRKARFAVRAGILIKTPCVKCGKPQVQAHHEDYSEPLKVTWLCRPCHVKHHIGKR